MLHRKFEKKLEDVKQQKKTTKPIEPNFTKSHKVNVSREYMDQDNFNMTSKFK